MQNSLELEACERENTKNFVITLEAYLALQLIVILHSWYPRDQ